MKELKQVVNETNMDKKDAFRMMKSNVSIGAKEFVGNTFKIKGYVIIDTQMTELETGEVTNGKSLCLLTETGEIIGSNSTALLKSFEEIKETFDDYLELDVKITKGLSKNGRTFLSLELA